MSQLNRIFKYEVLHLNIRGARGNGPNFDSYLEENHFPEIICLNETKLPADGHFVLNRYNIIARKETGMRGA